MSDLLNKASLVVIPSGYKEDTVYSVVPSDGAGDLSFTRASNGTRINSAGLVEVCPWNLIPNSQTFAIWNTVQISNTITVTDNFTTAPNGTLTAAKVVFNTFDATGQIFQDYVLAPTQNLTATLYAKVPSGTKQAYFGFYDGNVKTQLKTLTTEWQRIEYTGSIDASTIRACWFYGDGGASNVEVHLWGGQVNVGSTAKPYFPTTDRLNVPRLTYQNGGGGCPSLLLEKQSTNLTLYSEQFDNASWLQSNVTVTANQTTSPDGTQNADSLIPNTTNTGNHRVFESAINSVATASYSIFVKPNGYYRVALRECETTGSSIGFDLLNQTIITTYSTGGCTASGGKIENMGNGWYRISGIFSFASATAQRLGLYVVSSSWTSGDPESVAWSGNGTSGIFIWGAQLEASSYPTSYIPTTSASATRVADACFKTGISSLIGQTEGVLFAEIIVNITGVNQNLELGDGTGDNRVTMRLTTSNTFQLVIVQGSSVVFNQSSSATFSQGQKIKIAAAYKSGAVTQLFFNGVSVLSATSGTISGNLTAIYDGNAGGVSDKMNSPISQLVIFKTQLTNAELITLTS